MTGLFESPDVVDTERGVGADFLACVSCGAAHRLSELDRTPSYDLDGSAHGRDDRQSFRSAHAAHRVRFLRRAGDLEVRSHSRGDPMAQVVWQATDGDRSYLVTCERSDAASPRRYTVRRGRLVRHREAVDLDRDVVIGLLDDALYPYSAPAGKLALLVEAWWRRTEEISMDRFDPIGEDRRDPAVQLACVPPCLVEAYHQEVRRLFEGVEALRVIDLVDGELRQDIPIVRLERRYSIVTDDR
ncbi:MAG: hypothetical protein QOD06_3125 [Candidatus Binatota bacterium]|nr:hypothetical protein [Candidatus Binatota bacterium]